MDETYLEEDENVDETFLCTDRRYDNRRIRLLGILSIHPERGPIYRYEILTENSAPWNVGRHGKISRKTLKREYRKVSK